MFDTFYGRYLIYYIIMTSNLSFHNFLQTFSCTQLKIETTGKKHFYEEKLLEASIFLNFILLFFMCQVKTTLHQVCFALKKYKSNFLKREFQWFPSSPTNLTSKKASLSMVKFPYSLTCLKLI